MQQIEHIGKSPKTCDNNSQVQISCHTRWSAIIMYWRKVEKKRINKQSYQARNEKNPVPFQENITPRIKNFLLTWLMVLWENLKPPKSRSLLSSITIKWLFQVFLGSVTLFPGKFTILFLIIIKPKNMKTQQAKLEISESMNHEIDGIYATEWRHYLTSLSFFNSMLVVLVSFIHWDQTIRTNMHQPLQHKFPEFPIFAAKEQQIRNIKKWKRETKQASSEAVTMWELSYFMCVWIKRGTESESQRGRERERHECIYKKE